MSAQINMWPEMEIMKMEDDIDKLRRKWFAEQNAMAKDIRFLEAHVQELTSLVMELSEKLGTNLKSD